MSIKLQHIVQKPSKPGAKIKMRITVADEAPSQRVQLDQWYRAAVTAIKKQLHTVTQTYEEAKVQCALDQPIAIPKGWRPKGSPDAVALIDHKTVNPHRREPQVGDLVKPARPIRVDSWWMDHQTGAWRPCKYTIGRPHRVGFTVVEKVNESQWMSSVHPIREKQAYLNPKKPKHDVMDLVNKAGEDLL